MSSHVFHRRPTRQLKLLTNHLGRQAAAATHKDNYWSSADRQKSNLSTEQRSSSSSVIPAATKVVICGGGLFGTSIAYHLGQLGYKNVILLTQDV